MHLQSFLIWATFFSEAFEESIVKGHIWFMLLGKVLHTCAPYEGIGLVTSLIICFWWCNPSTVHRRRGEELHDSICARRARHLQWIEIHLESICSKLGRKVHLLMDANSSRIQPRAFSEAIFDMIHANCWQTPFVREIWSRISLWFWRLSHSSTVFWYQMQISHLFKICDLMGEKRKRFVKTHFQIWNSAIDHVREVWNLSAKLIVNPPFLSLQTRPRPPLAVGKYTPPERIFFESRWPTSPELASLPPILSWSIAGCNSGEALCSSMKHAFHSPQLFAHNPLAI